MTATPYEIARKFAASGYVCTPCDATSKHTGKVRYPDAWSTTEFDDPADWAGYPHIAINTNLSELVGFDIDVKKGKNGWESMERADFKLPETNLIIDTPSGGEHHVYRACPGVPIDTGQDILGMAGVDIRALKNGNLICPGVGIDGKKYVARDGIPHRDHIPELPRDIAERIAEWQSANAVRRRVLPLPPATPPEDVTTAQRDRLMRVVEYKLDDLRNAPPGQRYDATSAVMRIIGIGKALGNADELVERIRSVFPGDEDQLEGSIDRAIRAADPEVLPEDDARGFWDQRPELRHIKQAAYSRMVSPWAVLGATLVRVLADVPSTWQVDAGLGPGCLNLFTVLTGRSGAGKGEAIRTAAYLWPLPASVYETESASGEALPTLFAYQAKDAEGEWRTAKLRDSAIIASPEFSATRESGSRQGSTLLPRLCNGFSGESLTFAKADPTKTIDVPRDSYRLGLIAGLQDGNAHMLLAEAMTTTGLAQRVMWVPAQDRDVPRPEDKPDWPGALDQTTVRSLPDAGDIVTTCETARREVMEDRWRRSQPDVKVNPLDAHKFYIRLKVAYALALLNSHRNSIRDDDWELAGIVMGVSDATRQQMLDSMSERDRKRQLAVGKQEGIRKAAAADAEEAERLSRQVAVLRRGLDKNPDGMTRNQLKKCMDSRWQADYFDAALAQLTESGAVQISGETYYPAGRAIGET